MRPPKIDFRFLFYTSKYMYLKNTPFFNANLLKKYQNYICIYNHGRVKKYFRPNAWFFFDLG